MSRPSPPSRTRSASRSWSTTPSPPRTCTARWNGEPTWSSTRPASSSRGTARRSAARSSRPGNFDWSADPARWPQLDIAKHGSRAYAVYIRNTVAGRLGPTIAPFNAFLLQQGIETLSLRVERHSANALAVARWLAEQPEVESVDYAGLDDSPARAKIDRLYQNGNGSVFAFSVHGGEPAAAALIERLELFSHMSHLGDVRSLIMHPATTSHARLSDDEREQLGVGPGMLRVSIGIEDADDLIRDLRHGLDAAALVADAGDAASTPSRGADMSKLQHFGWFFARGFGPQGWGFPYWEWNYDWRRPEVYAQSARELDQAGLDILVIEDAISLGTDETLDLRIRSAYGGPKHDPLLLDPVPVRGHAEHRHRPDHQRRRDPALPGRAAGRDPAAPQLGPLRHERGHRRRRAPATSASKNCRTTPHTTAPRSGSRWSAASGTAGTTAP